MAVDITVELINGIKVGIEHVSWEDYEEGGGLGWLIALDLFILRIGINKYPEE